MSRTGRSSVLLRVAGLKVSYPAKMKLGKALSRPILAVDDVDLTIDEGEIVALVGESGSGKTSLALALLGLIRPIAGEIWFAGVNLVELDQREWIPHRRDLQLVFQDHLGAFDPLQTIGTSLGEAIRKSADCPDERKQDRCTSLLELVGLDPKLRDRYPTEVSAGQRQRAGIARALAVEPTLLVCDEIVSALDAAAARKILDLIREIRERLGIAVLFISHDLGVVRRIADRVLVMRAGRIVEEGPTRRVFDLPRHRYTQRLKDSLLSVDPRYPHLEQMAEP